jgi:hypothetical protein
VSTFGSHLLRVVAKEGETIAVNIADVAVIHTIPDKKIFSKHRISSRGQVTSLIFVEIMR